MTGKVERASGVAKTLQFREHDLAMASISNRDLPSVINTGFMLLDAS